MVDNEIKEFLEEKAEQYNTPSFIESDPVFIPHQFSLKEDIEISGLMAATIAWGNRKTILRNALNLISLMGNSPYDFIMNHREHNLEKFGGFVHRTFNATDAKYFIRALKNIYCNKGGLESLFAGSATPKSVIPAIVNFHEIFFSIPHPERTRKHVSNPAKGSPAKRINMWLRWMVRRDGRGVDLGIWDSLSPSQLSCPLDIHTGNIARRLGLITHKQNNLKALNELDTNLREMDPEDPVKYDFALFGLGIFEGFHKLDEGIGR